MLAAAATAAGRFSVADEWDGVRVGLEFKLGQHGLGSRAGLLVNIASTALLCINSSKYAASRVKPTGFVFSQLFIATQHTVHNATTTGTGRWLNGRGATLPKNQVVTRLDARRSTARHARPSILLLAALLPDTMPRHRWKRSVQSVRCWA